MNPFLTYEPDINNCYMDDIFSLLNKQKGPQVYPTQRSGYYKVFDKGWFVQDIKGNEWAFDDEPSQEEIDQL